MPSRPCMAAKVLCPQLRNSDAIAQGDIAHRPILQTLATKMMALQWSFSPENHIQEAEQATRGQTCAER